MRSLFIYCCILMCLSTSVSASCNIKSERLSNCDFSGKNLENYDFSNQNLKNINFSKSNLFGAVFNKTSLTNINFTDANLFGAIFIESSLDKVNFTRADISSADFTGADIKLTSFSSTTKEDTIFEAMIVEKADTLKANSCTLFIDNKYKHDWAIFSFDLALKGVENNYLLTSLCSFHPKANFKLKGISTSGKKEKVILTYNSCTFPAYVWTDKNKVHFEEAYNLTCIKNIVKTDSFRGISKDYCYRIKEYGPQSVCLGGTKTNNCNNIRDYALQKVCLEGARGNACSSFKDYAYREVCLKGIRTNACINFKEYKTYNSCKKFSGSTEFWLILAKYGYYTF